jgi:hypothetical protein
VVLTLKDCIALSELTAEEVDAIAEHEHISEIIAAELGNYLVHTVDGCRQIKVIIRDDIAAAQAHGDIIHAAKLKMVLKHFIEEHVGSSPRAQNEDAAKEVDLPQGA